MAALSRVTGFMGMWVRKRIEITSRELLRALWYCVSPASRGKAIAAISGGWTQEQAVVCLSVRSGFDLLLHSSGWPRASEVIMSGLTIPDMPRIVEENGYRPVGIDVELSTAGPNLDALRAAITPRTRAIVVAHLLGGLCELTPILELARQHNLMVIEDCAQAWTGKSYQGDPRSDVSMFSFGPIKTNTALGGGVLVVRNAPLRQSMLRQHDQWRIQTRWTACRRFSKFALVKLLSTRPVCGAIYRLMRLTGRDHDGIASRMARGFAGSGFFQKIRKQPSLPLLRLLRHKLESWRESNTAERCQHGQFLRTALGPDIAVFGSDMIRQTWWVFPVLVHNPDKLVRRLWDAGFDASNSCSLHAIFDSNGSSAEHFLRHVVFLPLHTDMPKSELSRMARIVRECSGGKPLVFEATRRDDPEATGSNGSIGNQSAAVAVEDDEREPSQPAFSPPFVSGSPAEPALVRPIAR